MKKTQSDKVIVVSSILYIAGQFPRPLNKNWSLLVVLVGKLHEFMDYDFPGLPEMACNSFLKICQSCKESLAKNHAKNKESDQILASLDPIVWDIFKNIGDKINRLSIPNKLLYYESIGVILSAIQRDEVLMKAISTALNQLITSWKSFLASVGVQSDILKKDETLLNISFFINVNEKLNSCIGTRYIIVFEVIFNEMVIIYNFYSDACREEFAQNPNCLTYYNFRKMRAVKRDVLKMFTTFIQNCQPTDQAATKFLPPLFNILQTFKDEPIQLREAELILLFAKVLETFSSKVSEYVPKILECIFGGTLNMISADFKSYPDHRVNFFVFLKIVAEKNFESLLNIPQEQLETIINCMIWSIKHELTSIYEVGLESLLALLTKVNTNQQLANSFYKTYLMRIFNDVFYVLIDKLHANGFELQMNILKTLISVLDCLSVNLGGEGQNNRQYVVLQVYNQMVEGFPNLAKEDHQKGLEAIFTTYNDENQFKISLKDYIAQLDLFTNTELTAAGKT